MNIKNIENFHKKVEKLFLPNAAENFQLSRGKLHSSQGNVTTLWIVWPRSGRTSPALFQRLLLNHGSNSVSVPSLMSLSLPLSALPVANHRQLIF